MSEYVCNCFVRYLIERPMLVTDVTSLAVFTADIIGHRKFRQSQTDHFLYPCAGEYRFKKWFSENVTEVGWVATWPLVMKASALAIYSVIVNLRKYVQMSSCIICVYEMEFIQCACLPVPLPLPYSCPKRSPWILKLSFCSTAASELPIPAELVIVLFHCKATHNRLLWLGLAYVRQLVTVIAFDLKWICCGLYIR